MNRLFMLNEWPIHCKRTDYSSTVNGMFIFGIFLSAANALYINILHLQ